MQVKSFIDTGTGIRVCCLLFCREWIRGVHNLLIGKPLHYKLLQCRPISVASLMSQSTHLNFLPRYSCYWVGSYGQHQCCAPPWPTSPVHTDMAVFTNHGQMKQWVCPIYILQIATGCCICMTILGLGYIWWDTAGWRLLGVSQSP
jgi:hypothetical protein